MYFEIIGSGTFGEVYKFCENNIHYAAKKINLNEFDKNIHCLLHEEYKVLQKLNHPNIIKYIQHSTEPNLIIIITEFWGCNIYNLILNKPNLKLMMQQMLSALNYLHDKYIHRDIKPENIVYHRGVFKLIDFGKTIDKEEQELTIETTLWYAAPEVLLGFDNYSTYIDIWSLGCIFYEKYFHKNGNVLFKGSDQNDQLFRIFNILGKPTCKFYSQFDFLKNVPEFNNQIFSHFNKFNMIDSNFLLSMIEYDPLKRSTASQLLNHNYFKI